MAEYKEYKKKKKKNKNQDSDKPGVQTTTRTNINWFPGHMAKTRRLISENLKNVDIIIELLDARIPQSSKNPEIQKLIADKPVLTLFTKSSIADDKATREWVRVYSEKGGHALPVDCITGENVGEIGNAIRRILADKIKKNEEKGLGMKKLRAMIVGIPNVGKSSLINKLSGHKKAKVENRPGVTTNLQWVTTTQGFDLLDTPGILWPKFEDAKTGENLAMTGAIKDAILDTDELGMVLAAKLREMYPTLLCDRYKLVMEEIEELDSYDLLMAIGRKRGFLMSGGEINLERTALMLLDEFRNCKIGRITLDRP